VVALRRDDETRPYQPAAKVVDDTTLPAPTIVPLDERDTTTPAPLAPAEPSPSPAAAREQTGARADREDGTRVTGEMKGTAGATTTEPEVTESFPPRRVTDPAMIELSREQMQLMRHFELEKTNVVAKVCIDTNGVPNDVTVVRSSGVDEVDKATVETIRSWTYLPQVTDGRLVAACTDVKVNYQLRE
jgi:TonB family protein